MLQKVRFIINPISGVGKKNKLPTLIEKNLNHSIFKYDIVYTKEPKHATQLSKQAVAEGIDIVCAVGGDGSINEIAKSLINTNVKLAIIPCGSGNGLARHLKISLNISKSIKTINLLNEKEIDVGLANNHHFFSIAGIGFDAHIAYSFCNLPKRGFISYARLVLKEFKNYKPFSIYWKEENKSFDNLFLVTIANSCQFGNGFKIAPKASLSDGKLNVALVEKTSFLKFLPLLFMSYFTDVSKSKYVHSFEVSKISLSHKKKLLQVDGESEENQSTELNITVIAKGVKILVGK